MVKIPLHLKTSHYHLKHHPPHIFIIAHYILVSFHNNSRKFINNFGCCYKMHNHIQILESIILLFNL